MTPTVAPGFTDCPTEEQRSGESSGATSKLGMAPPQKIFRVLDTAHSALDLVALTNYLA